MRRLPRPIFPSFIEGVFNVWLEGPSGAHARCHNLSRLHFVEADLVGIRKFKRGQSWPTRRSTRFSKIRSWNWRTLASAEPRPGFTPPRRIIPAAGIRCDWCLKGTLARQQRDIIQCARGTWRPDLLWNIRAAAIRPGRRALVILNARKRCDAQQHALRRFRNNCSFE
jgi:hypothetical protein